MTELIFSRRELLAAGLASSTAISTGSALGSQSDADTAGQADSTNQMPIRLAGYPYARVQALRDALVSVNGCQVHFEESRIGELNQHVFSGPATRDVSEVGLIPFLLAFCNDDFRKYQLLPLFVLKVFRHKSIFVRADNGITEPQDLRGRRVATVGYSSSGLTWIRGLLQDEYGVKPEEIQWVVTPKDSASQQTGGASKWEKQLPASLQFEMAPDGMSDSELLLDGQVDAIFHPAEPRAFVQRNPRIRRLFEGPSYGGTSVF